jgi:hypothetical protein
LRNKREERRKVKMTKRDRGREEKERRKKMRHSDNTTGSNVIKLFRSVI